MINQDWLTKQQDMAVDHINKSTVPQNTISFWCGYLAALNRVQEQHDAGELANNVL